VVVLKRLGVPTLRTKVVEEGLGRLGLSPRPSPPPSPWEEEEDPSSSVPAELTCVGETISVVDAEAREGVPQAQRPAFDLDAFQRHLQRSSTPDDRRGEEEVWTLLSARQLASTQKMLEENAKNLPDRTIVVADTQTEGKGRAGNKWISPPGCLMCSIYCNIAMEGRKLPLLQYATTLAAVQALEMLCGDSGKGPLGSTKPFASIKWPNDVYINGTKVGGVLCQTVYKGSGAFQLIAGIGINVDNAEPTFCINQALRDLDREEIAKEELLAEMIPRLVHAYRVIAKDSFSPLHEEYYRYWLHSGQKLKVKADASLRDGEGGEDKDVVVVGLSEDGFLLAQDEKKVLVELYPDGNSLDLMSGLVCKKKTRA